MTRALCLIVLAFLLSACGTAVPVPSLANGPPPAPINPPSTPLWVMRPRSWAEYRIYRGPGKFNPLTGYIEFDMKDMVIGELNRTTNLLFQSVRGPTIARVYSPGGIQVDQVSDTLDAALGEMSDGRFIGESSNYAQKDQWPPEPLLSLNPYKGETFDVESQIISWDGTQFLFKTRYRTLDVNVDFMGFKNCAVTGLIEQPDTPSSSVYCQAFDGEIAAQWYGVVKADNSMDIILALRTATGQNA